MLASKTSTKPSVVWQGSTKDGYTLRLTRSALTQISSQLKQTGLEPLVRSFRSNNPGSLESAVVGAIAQVVNQATASGTVSSREFGRNLRSFTAMGKTKTYQILTQPSDPKHSVIIFVRSRPIQEFEYEDEYESELQRRASTGAVSRRSKGRRNSGPAILPNQPKYNSAFPNKKPSKPKKTGVDNRHNITDPQVNATRWLNTMKQQRVNDLFRTLEGLPGHVQQIQNEINRVKRNLNGKTGTEVTAYINALKSLRSALIASARNAKFNFSKFGIIFSPLGSDLYLQRQSGRLRVDGKLV